MTTKIALIALIGLFTYVSDKLPVLPYGVIAGAISVSICVVTAFIVYKQENR